SNFTALSLDCSVLIRRLQFRSTAVRNHFRNLRMAGCSWTSRSSLRRDQRRQRANPAEAPLAAMEIRKRGGEIGGAEVGPQRVDETELGVRGFPEQEIGQPLFAARADEQIDVGARLAILPGEQGAEGVARGGLRTTPTRGGIEDGVARRIVDG